MLNRPDQFSERSRRKVQAAIDALGFVRNESARQLHGGRSRTLAYVVFDVSNPFITDVARGAQEAADEAGLALYLCDSGEDPLREKANLDPHTTRLISQNEDHSPVVRGFGSDGTPPRAIWAGGHPGQGLRERRVDADRGLTCAALGWMRVFDLLDVAAPDRAAATR
jgi:LacI family transcriptional regulator